jgi:hypothetical protein
LRNTDADRADQLSILQSLHQQEQTDLEYAHDPTVGEEPEGSSSTTAWLDYTAWPTQFADRPLRILVATACLPARDHLSDYVLGA